ncbi:MAG: hypothetical protein RL630_1793 [Verrucomicrobiota bacterium]|jgi:hypothetical protein
MTNIQTLPSKSQPTESGRAEMGNFFQALGTPVAGNLSNPDFDSFLSNPESKTQAEELQEEQEAAKKRKKQIDAALVTPSIPTQDTPIENLGKNDKQLSESKILEPVLSQDLNADPSDLSTPKSPESALEKAPSSNSGDSIENPAASTLSELNEKEKAQPSNPSDSIENPTVSTSSESGDGVSTEDQLLSLKEDQTKSDTIAESKSESRGTETASPNDEMIALTTVDGSESPAQAIREPSITSINRLAAYATLDRNAITPLGNSSSSSDSGLGNPASGMPMPIQTIRPQAATASSQASALFKTLAPELDKFKQTGNSQIQLDLPVGEQESVRIKLSLRGGEIRSTFITESPELREALQKAWPEFSQNSRDRGYRLGDPAFQQGFQENSANLGENNRRQPDNRTYETVEPLTSSNLRKGTSNRPTTSQTPSTALWA